MIAAAWLFAKALAGRAAGAVWAFIRRNPAIAALVLVTLICGALALQLHRMREWLADAQIDALNANARADISANIAGIDSTKLATATRQAVQEKVRADSIDRLLHLRPVARARVEIVMPATTIHATADSVVHRDSARVLSFDLRATPYTAHADVTVPDDTTARPLIRLGIAIDTAGLWVHVGCVGDTARVAFTAPPWLSLRAGAAEQEPRVCQRIAPHVAPVSHAKRNAAVITGAAIVGAVLHNNLRAWLGHRARRSASPAPLVTP